MGFTKDCFKNSLDFQNHGETMEKCEKRQCLVWVPKTRKRKIKKSEIIRYQHWFSS